MSSRVSARGLRVPKSLRVLEGLRGFKWDWES